MGACLGSFSSVLIYKLRFDEPLTLWQRTQHFVTKKSASVWQLLPFFSWRKLTEKKHATKNIPVIYLWVEIIFTVVFGLFAYKYLVFEPNLFNIWQLGILFCLLFFALVIFFYDALYFLVDRRISFPAIVLALIWALAQPDWQNFLLGGAIGFGFYYLQYFLSGGKWVGAGDQEIGLFMGLVLGWEFLLYGLFLSYVIGSVYALGLKIFGQKIHLQTALPMGAFLIPAMILMMYDGDWMAQQYWDLFTFPLFF